MQNKLNKNIKLCLGIDPNPTEHKFKQFKECVYKHMEILDFCKNSLCNIIIKPQFAFFLSFGNKGLLLLEELVAQFQNTFTIILDGKFNDISNSLQAYLHFAFNTLGVHGLTISPFLGEKSIQISFEYCAKRWGKRGRVYILCATTESSSQELSFIHNNWKNILLATSKQQKAVFKNTPDLYQIAGVVVGANHNSILLSPEIKDSGLSILAPGLGFQSQKWNIIKECANQPNEIIFPISRAIFAGGNTTTLQMHKNLNEIQQYF